MKKNLIALAVAAAVAAPMAASADATIYGRLHADFASVSDGDSSTTAITNNASRIGFKGSEDLMGSTKAIWQIESSIGSDSSFNTGAAVGSRNTFVGLSGGWGTALLGKHDTPYKIIGRKVDLFGDQYGDTRALTNALGHDARAPNVLAYASPKWGGFSFMLAYHTNNAVDNEGTDGFDEGKGAAYSGNIQYKGSIFWVGAAYQQFEEANAFNTGTDTSTAARIAAKVNVGGFFIQGDYTDQESKDFESSGENLKYSTLGGGLGYKFGGKHVIKGQYYQAEAEVAGDKAKGNTGSIGYDFKMSKKTTVGVFYTMVSNGDNTTAGTTEGDYNFNLWKSPLGVAAEDNGDAKNPSAFGVYTKVNF
jgi:predicted porin